MAGQRSHHLLLGTILALGSACSSAKTPPPSEPALPAPAPVVSAEPQPEVQPVQATKAEPAPPRTRPEVVGAELAKAWCARGGSGFGPVGTPEALPNCSKIVVTVAEQKNEGGLESAVIELRPEAMFSEEERYLYLRRGETEAVFFLVQGFSSGVGGFSHEIQLSNVRVADIAGDEAVEWSAEIVSESHDSDMGICALHGSEHRDFVVCSSTSKSFECLQLPLVDVSFEETASRDKAGECGPPKVVRSGFAASVQTAKGDIRVEPLPASKMEGPITKPKPLPHRGKVDVVALTAKYPAKRVVF